MHTPEGHDDRAHFGRFVENPDPTTPNGHSLLVAEPCVRDRFFLQMVDHLFAEPVLRRRRRRRSTIARRDACSSIVRRSNSII